MKTLNVNQIVSEVQSHLETACGEIASDMLSPAGGFLDYEWGKRIKKAKKNGVQDLLGWLADELYNDAATLQDLMGDKIYDLTNGNEELQNQVLDALSSKSHPAMKKACKELKR